MGWLFYHRPAGETDREHFQRRLLGTAHTIIHCASIDNAFYAAVRDELTEDVWALVVLFCRQLGEYNFGYKSMDETHGPAAADAPAAVLDALTPTTDKHALHWRQQCRTNLDKRDDLRARRKAITVGTMITIAEPLRFANGHVASRFECIERSGRVLRWRAVTDSGYRFICTLGPNWARRYQWSVVPSMSTNRS